MIFLQINYLEITCVKMQPNNRSFQNIIERGESAKKLENYHPTMHKENTLPDLISWNIFTFMLMISILAPFCILLWLKYLQDQPLNKQSLMNKLVQDVIRLNLMVVLIWTLPFMMLKLLERSNQEEFLTGFISIISHALFHLIIIYLYLIGGLRLYTIRLRVLDPLEELMVEYDESMAMNILRLCFTLIVLFDIGIFCLTSTKPIEYYHIWQQGMPWISLPLGTRILFGIDVGILMICSVFYILLKMYQSLEDSKLRTTVVVDIEVSNRVGLINSGDVNSEWRVQGNQDSAVMVRKQGKGRAFVDSKTLPAFVHVASISFLALLVGLQYLELINLGFWWTMTTFLGIEGVLIPSGLILWYSELRSYSRRQIQYHAEATMACLNAAISWFRKRIPTVHPI